MGWNWMGNRLFFFSVSRVNEVRVYIGPAKQHDLGPF